MQSVCGYFVIGFEECVVLMFKHDVNFLCDVGCF